jgi:AraC family transcriptional regulator of arabinose operon
VRAIDRRELAALAAVSESHLSRIFDGTIGLAPVHALEAVRLIRAVHLLSRSNLTVAAVAAATGFTSPYHFSRRCSTVLGLPPSRLRDETTAASQLAGLPAAVHRLADTLTTPSE